MTLRWQYESSTDKDYIFEVAINMGWYENKVQVRKIVGMETWYVIEPYEEGCNCPELIRPRQPFEDG